MAKHQNSKKKQTTAYFGKSNKTVTLNETVSAKIDAMRKEAFRRHLEFNNERGEDNAGRK